MFFAKNGMRKMQAKDNLSEDILEEITTVFSSVRQYSVFFISIQFRFHVPLEKFVKNEMYFLVEIWEKGLSTC